MSDPIIPMDDDELERVREQVHPTDEVYQAFVTNGEMRRLLARLDAAEERADSLASTLRRVVDESTAAQQERDAALASQEGVVTLTDKEQRHINRLRDKRGLYDLAGGQGRATPDDRHADEAALDLLSSISDDWVIALPHLLAALDRAYQPEGTSPP